MKIGVCFCENNNNPLINEIWDYHMHDASLLLLLEAEVFLFFFIKKVSQLYANSPIGLLGPYNMI